MSKFKKYNTSFDKVMQNTRYLGYGGVSELARDSGLNFNTVQSFRKGNMTKIKHLLQMASLFECDPRRLIEPKYRSLIGVKFFLSIKRTFGIVRHEKHPDSIRVSPGQYEDDYVDFLMKESDSLATLKDMIPDLQKNREYGVHFEIIEFNKGHKYDTHGADPRLVARVEKGEVIWS